MNHSISAHVRKPIMAECESREKNIVQERGEKGPPELQFTIKNFSDLKVTSKRWKEVELPIDILLLTVDKYGFLCCFHYLREVFRSFKLALGHVYFGEMGESDSETLQVALIQCCEGGGQPGGAGITLPKAVEVLRPKAVFCLGSCAALHDKTRLGDVVAAAKLTTYAQRRVTANKVVACGFSIPASKSISQLIPCAAHGWKPPLKNPELKHEEVNVHSNGEILSGPEEIASVSRRNELVQLYPNAIAVEMDGDGELWSKVCLSNIVSFSQSLLTRVVVAVIIIFFIVKNITTHVPQKEVISRITWGEWVYESAFYRNRTKK